MKRRIFAILLSLTMMFTLVPTAWALSEEENRTPAPMETSENGEGTEGSGSVAPAMNGNCGAVGSEDSVKWALTDDDGDGSYTLLHDRNRALYLKNKAFTGFFLTMGALVAGNIIVHSIHLCRNNDQFCASKLFADFDHLCAASGAGALLRRQFTQNLLVL